MSRSNWQPLFGGNQKIGGGGGPKTNDAGAASDESYYSDSDKSASSLGSGMSGGGGRATGVKPNYKLYLYYVVGKHLERYNKQTKRKSIIKRNVIDIREPGYLYFVKKNSAGVLKVHKRRMKNSSSRRKKPKSAAKLR